MLTYKAAYKFLDEGVHAQILDFRAVISCGDDLDEARQMLASALVDVADLYLDTGKSLPKPDPSLIDTEFDIDEPMHLHLTASSAVVIEPAGMVVP